MTKIVTIKQAAEVTGLSVWELRQGFKAGRYPGLRVGNSKKGKIIFDLDILDEHIKNMMLASVKPKEPQKNNGIRSVGI